MVLYLNIPESHADWLHWLYLKLLHLKAFDIFRGPIAVHWTRWRLDFGRRFDWHRFRNLHDFNTEESVNTMES